MSSPPQPPMSPDERDFDIPEFLLPKPEDPPKPQELRTCGGIQAPFNGVPSPAPVVQRRPMVPGYRRQLDRETGKVLYFRKLPPGYLCGGPEEPYIVDVQPLDSESLPESWKANRALITRPNPGQGLQ